MGEVLDGLIIIKMKWSFQTSILRELPDWFGIEELWLKLYNYF